jgi:hypothetical protein
MTLKWSSVTPLARKLIESFALLAVWAREELIIFPFTCAHIQRLPYLVDPGQSRQDFLTHCGS